MVEDNQIKTEVSPFAVREGEIKTLPLASKVKIDWNKVINANTRKGHPSNKDFLNFSRFWVKT